MTGKRVTIGELFADLQAKNEAAWNDPENIARREASSTAYRARIDAEIASGLRDEDGEWIDTGADDDEDTDDQEPGAETDDDEELDR